MAIERISGAFAQGAGISAEARKAAGGDEPFGALVRSAVESLETNQQKADFEVARAVAGESPDLHRTIIALQSAELGFQLALQVRNKVVNAYEEIMRMQV
jgi:flagellar hook-basal body complex protein FliE